MLEQTRQIGVSFSGSEASSLGKMTAQPVLDVIMPVHNEADIIRNVILNYYNEIATKLPSRLIIAEDGSNDGTSDILMSLKNIIPIVLFSDPCRKGYAKGVGDALRKCSSEWIFFSDSDGQYYSADFWQLWENREGYDIIIGRKVHRDESVHRVILANGFHMLANALFGLKFHDADCGFRLIRKEVIESVVEEVKFLQYSYNAEFAIRATLKGFKVLEVPIGHARRPNGETQIYKPSKIPLILVKQLLGLANLYAETRKNPAYNHQGRKLNLKD
jgi:dolichol-phosphate mannosyltransferase